MARYYFDTTDGTPQIDREGQELADPAAARIVAICYAGDIIRDQPDLLTDRGDFRVAVTDEGGALLFTLVILAVDAVRPLAASG